MAFKMKGFNGPFKQLKPENLPRLVVDNEMSGGFYNPHPLDHKIVIGKESDTMEKSRGNKNGIQIKLSKDKNNIISGPQHTLDHEIHHWDQMRKGKLFESELQRHPTGPVTDETLYSHYNRRDKDLERHKNIVRENKYSKLGNTYIEKEHVTPHAEHNMYNPDQSKPTAESEAVAHERKLNTEKGYDPYVNIRNYLWKNRKYKK